MNRREWEAARAWVRARWALVRDVQGVRALPELGLVRLRRLLTRRRPPDHHLREAERRCVPRGYVGDTAVPARARLAVRRLMRPGTLAEQAMADLGMDPWRTGGPHTPDGWSS